MFKLIGKLIKWSIYVSVGCTILLVGLGMSIDTPVDTNKVTKNEVKVETVSQEEIALKNEEKRKGFHCLSAWNGSHRGVVKFTKKQLRDPKSFEHDKTLVWPVDVNGNHQLVMQYRAKNGFGGMTSGVVKAEFSNDTCSAIVKSID